MIAAMCPKATHRPRELVPSLTGRKPLACPTCQEVYRLEEARWRLSNSQARALRKLAARGRDGLYGGTSGATASMVDNYEVTTTLESLERAGLARNVMGYSWSRYTVTLLGERVVKAASR